MELWFVGLLIVVGLIKVVAELFRRRERRVADLRGPFLLDWPDPAGPMSSLPLETPLIVEPAPPVAVPTPAPSLAATTPAPPQAVATPAPQPSFVEVDEASETIRIDVSDGRVQFLPGRLEVVRGVEAGREFHFLRVPGQTVPEVTLGRSNGAMYRHIQISEPTVSRLHARLSYEDRLWRIANLSETNPIRVNGQDLGSPDEAVTLFDGDRIELGDVELCYRDRRP